MYIKNHELKGFYDLIYDHNLHKFNILSKDLNMFILLKVIVNNINMGGRKLLLMLVLHKLKCLIIIKI